MQATKTTVRDLMQTKVVRLDPSATVREAIELIEDAGISGAPVVDSAGAVLGVVSLRNLAEASEVGAGRPEGQRNEFYLADPEEDRPYGEPDELSDVEDYSPSAMGDGTVAEWMTTDLVTVKPTDSIRDAARKMVEHRVHRVLALENGKLKGILTTTDFVRFVAEQG
jgi:CBS domain-containing protein